MTPSFAIEGAYIDDKLEEIALIEKFAEKKDANIVQGASLETFRYLNDLENLSATQSE